MTEPVLIDRRFRGPPASANGGYACGLVAQLVEDGDGTIEATLHAPPPLDRRLAASRDSEGGGELRDDGTVVATARRVPPLELDLPAPVSFEDAVAAGESCPWADEHVYPMCFVCGPDREPPDGLRLLFGPVPGREVIADAWTPDPSLAGADGAVDPLIVWSVLDCPTGNGAIWFQRIEVPVLLGRLTARLLEPVVAGEAHVVVGWPIGAEGRKHFGGSAIIGEDGRPRAVAIGTWIEVKSAT
jgi:hypothetical protein